MARIHLTRLFGLACIVLMPTFACDCGTGGFIQLPEDAGPEPEPDPPAPPVFPLKAGDIVEVPVIGARTEPCAGAQGDCDRSIRATFTLRDVVLDTETGTWTLDSDYLYTLEKATTSYQSMSRLFISNAAPFAQLDDNVTVDSGEGVTFRTNVAPDDSLREDGFPFFHYEAAYSTTEGSAYDQAATAFRERIFALDPSAEVGSQAAAGKIEAFFRDDRGEPIYLHKVRVEYHPFGFVCGWDEAVVPWVDGMARNNGPFSGDQPIVASFNAVFVRRDIPGRDSAQFRCSCFDKRCSLNNNGETICLDPTDPDAVPSAAACNN